MSHDAQAPSANRAIERPRTAARRVVAIRAGRGCRAAKQAETPARAETFGSRATGQQVKPLVRWAGSKRPQLPRLRAFWSESHTGYVEPFAGSACLFFAIAPLAAVLGDANRELIDFYKVVRHKPERLYRRLCRIRRDAATYQKWRSIDPHSLDHETRALRFIYLNRNCFNGIYRTNLDGKFNVPMGKEQGAYLSKAELMRCSEFTSTCIARSWRFRKNSFSCEGWKFRLLQTRPMLSALVGFSGNMANRPLALLTYLGFQSVCPKYARLEQTSSFLMRTVERRAL